MTALAWQGPCRALATRSPCRWPVARHLRRLASRGRALGLVLVASLATGAVAAVELVIATVDNPHMLVMQQLGAHFERANPGVRLKWVTLSEGALRQRVGEAITRRSGEFDVMTIGLYETPLWARKGWLQPIQPGPGYDSDDLLPAVRQGLSHAGQLYAAPFYGESSMLMYRSDLAAKAGVRYTDSPTWAQVRDAAARMHQPQAGVYGICLRGKPGWGDNMALVTTLVNGFGGQWFNMAWQPQLQSPAWHEAVSMYVDLLQRYGPPDAARLGFNENLALFAQGRCAQWVDATIAASVLTDARRSQVAARVAFAPAPHGSTRKGAHWLWAWALAVPQGSRHGAEAQRFVAWATSRDYIRLVGREQGWVAVPTGTRKSTYTQPEFLKAAPFAQAEKQAIASADPIDPTLPPSPYLGIQFVAIPEFTAVGDATGQQIALALAGRISVAQALKAAQAQAEQAMRATKAARPAK